MTNLGASFERLKVAVRERPLREDEKGKVQLMLRPDGDKLIAFYPDSKEGLLYNYDYFFPEEASQLDVFQSIGLEMVELALDGYSASCVSYGPSGTGKTHTLFGSDHEAGLIQLATKELFQRMETSTTRQYNIRLSYWEMDCDKIEDALVGLKGDDATSTTQRQQTSRYQAAPPKPTAKPAVQRTDDGVVVNNLTTVPVGSWEELDEVLMHGNIRRIQLSEERGARWHGFVKVFVDYTDESDPDRIVSSALTFVHLKGSDRVGQKGARGNALQHGSVINKSLSLLSSALIHALSYRRKEIPKAQSDEEFREAIRNSQSFFMESRLTQVLGQCMCGLECAYVIGAISALDYHEATDTLELLQNAQQLTACPVRRTKLTAKGKLREKVSTLEQKLPQRAPGEGHPLKEIEERVLRLRRKLNRMEGIEEDDEDELLRQRMHQQIEPIDTTNERQLWKANVLKAKLHGNRHTIYVPNTTGTKNNYTGQWAHGKKEGLGKHETETSRYEGGWKDGMRHGEGTLWLRPKGSTEWERVYTGGWKFDKRDGIGHDLPSSGDVYEGGFVAGKRDGIGKMMLPNGDRIEGQFKDGLVHGLAMLYCKNGDWFEGSWFGGLREGPGIWHYTTKQQLYEGEWHKGVAKVGTIRDDPEKETNANSSYLPRVELADKGDAVLEHGKEYLNMKRKELGINVVSADHLPDRSRDGNDGQSDEQVYW